MDQESDTFGNLLIQKGLQLAILPNYKCPWIHTLPTFAGIFLCQKSESFQKKVQWKSLEANWKKIF